MSSQLGLWMFHRNTGGRSSGFSCKGTCVCVCVCVKESESVCAQRTGKTSSMFHITWGHSDVCGLNTQQLNVCKVINPISWRCVCVCVRVLPQVRNKAQMCSCVTFTLTVVSNGAQIARVRFEPVALIAFPQIPPLLQVPPGLPPPPHTHTHPYLFPERWVRTYTFTYRHTTTKTHTHTPLRM